MELYRLKKEQFQNLAVRREYFHCFSVQKEYKKDLENEIKGKGMEVGMDIPDIQRAKKASEMISQVSTE